MTEIERMQENLKSAIALIEQGRTVHKPDCEIAYAPTGDYFLSWVSGGLKHEGTSVGVWCTSPETALTWMLRHVLGYKEKTPGVVYWRKRPTINVENFLKISTETSPLVIRQETTAIVCPLYFAWCRLVITDKPILSPEELQKLRGGKSVEQLIKDAHHSSPQPNEGRGDGKLEGH